MSLCYPGSKNGAGVVQMLINEIPPHHAYFELFLGSGSVLRNKLPAHVNLGIDVDPQTVDVFARLTGAKKTPAPVVRTDYVAGVAVSCGCALTFLESYEGREGDFLYLDPPYLESTRRGGSRPIYRHEFMREQQHEALLSLVVDIQVPVAISGYSSELYDRALKGWRRITYQAMTHAGLSEECLWMNYPEPEELHDYRFLGNNRTDRQRIKRKKQRWAAKLRALPLLERRAVYAALQELLA